MTLIKKRAWLLQYVANRLVKEVKGFNLNG
jgi:hypothetical protein